MSTSDIPSRTRATTAASAAVRQARGDHLRPRRWAPTELCPLASSARTSVVPPYSDLWEPREGNLPGPPDFLDAAPCSRRRLGSAARSVVLTDPRSGCGVSRTTDGAGHGDAPACGRGRQAEQLGRRRVRAHVGRDLIDQRAGLLLGAVRAVEPAHRGGQVGLAGRARPVATRRRPPAMDRRSYATPDVRRAVAPAGLGRILEAIGAAGELAIAVAQGDRVVGLGLVGVGLGSIGAGALSVVIRRARGATNSTSVPSPLGTLLIGGGAHEPPSSLGQRWSDSKLKIDVLGLLGEPPSAATSSGRSTLRRRRTTRSRGIGSSWPRTVGARPRCGAGGTS
jgi:hypothetical protein